MTLSHFDAKEFKQVVDDYIKRMESIHDKRIEFVELELKLVCQESRAFNLLRQQLRDIASGNHPSYIICDNGKAYVENSV